MKKKNENFDWLPKEKNQTHNLLICPNGKFLMSKMGTLGSERDFFFVGLFNSKEEAIKYSGVKDPHFFKTKPEKLPWSKLDFVIYDFGWTNFWVVIAEETLSKLTKKNGTIIDSGRLQGLPKFVAARCKTMDSASASLDEFCKYTGFKKGKVVVWHFNPRFDDNGKEIPQG